MTTSDFTRLATIILPPATSFQPADGRKYTMTHDDNTGELFVSIGCRFDDGRIGELRDEVLAEWVPCNGQYMLSGQVLVSDGGFDEQTAEKRYRIFRREMDKALTAIVMADMPFYGMFPWFLDFPICIQYRSVYPQYNKFIQYDTPRTYLNKGFEGG